MTSGAFTAMVKGLAPVIRDYVGQALKAVDARIVALEQREAGVGPVGPPGPPGEKGEPGMQGPEGPQGAAGAPGLDGAIGPQGPAGVAGERGLTGADGAPGRDGRDGLIGPPGEKGLDGRNGIDGKDGADGFGFDHMDVEHDGERAFSFTFKQGDRVKTFGPFIVPSVIYRGVYEPGRAYEKGDASTWGGSLWIAMTTTTAKPGESGLESRAWVLATKKGADGKHGKDAPSLVTVKA